MGTPEAEIMAGYAFIDRAVINTKRARESMKTYAQRTKLFCSSLTGYTNQMMQVFEDIDVGMEDLKSFDEAHIDLATKTLERMTKLFNDLVLNPLLEWTEVVKERKKTSKEFIEIKKKRDHYEKKINGIKDKLAKGKAKVEYLRKNEEKLKQWKQQYATAELKAVEETRKFRMEHCKVMRTCVARLIQFETQLFKELGTATGKLDGAVKNLLDHTELEEKLRRDAFKLKKDTIGEGDYVLEKRLSDMEKRFEAMNKNTDKKKKMPKANNSINSNKTSTLKKLPKKPKSRSSLGLKRNEKVNTMGNDNNNDDDWGADVFNIQNDSTGVGGNDDDWGFGDTSSFNNDDTNGSNVEYNNNNNNNVNNDKIVTDHVDFSSDDAFGSGWDTTAPNITTTTTTRRTSSSSSPNNDQSYDPWNSSPDMNISKSLDDTAKRANSTDAWPSPAAATFGHFEVNQEDNFFGSNNNDNNNNKTEMNAFGDDFGFSGMPNNQKNNTRVSTDAFGEIGNNVNSNSQDIFGIAPSQNQNNFNNNSGMDPFFNVNNNNNMHNNNGGNNTSLPPSKPAPRKPSAHNNNTGNGSGGSNPFLDF